MHHQYEKPDALFPYLPRHYVEYIKDFGPMMPGIGYTNMPGHGARHDLWTDQEKNPVTQPSVLIEKHLNVYDIGVGVLTGGPYAAQRSRDRRLQCGGELLRYPQPLPPPGRSARGARDRWSHRRGSIRWGTNGKGRFSNAPDTSGSSTWRRGGALCDEKLRVRTYRVALEGEEVVLFV